MELFTESSRRNDMQLLSVQILYHSFSSNFIFCCLLIVLFKFNFYKFSVYFEIIYFETTVDDTS